MFSQLLQRDETWKLFYWKWSCLLECHSVKRVILESKKGTSQVCSQMKKFVKKKKMASAGGSRGSDNFPRLLCILTSFWLLRPPKSWSKHLLISGMISLKRFEMNEKGRKRAKKMLQPVFGCAQHPVFALFVIIITTYQWKKTLVDFEYNMDV